MYSKITEDMKIILSDFDNKHPFRRRSEHCMRVFTWAKRLIQELNEHEIDGDAILIAALFHDVGYSISAKGTDHANNGAVIFDNYAIEQNYDCKKAEFISYLIRSHAKKELMANIETPLELIILMEADMLDETGALSIVFDCMAEGVQEQKSYNKTYKHIQKYSVRILETNPMITETAKRIWRKKQELVKEFIQQLAYDIDCT
jgi:uncharacterized protein